ncbi:MAG: tyrosine-type recombinase/integrase [Rhodanobacter sp.]
MTSLAAPPPLASGTVPRDAATHLAKRKRRAEKAFAANTRRALASDWRVWVAFCTHRGCPTMPAAVDDVEAFLEAQIEGGKKRSTMDRYLSSLAQAHRVAEVPNPLDTEDGRLMLKAFRRDERISAYRKQTKGMGWEHVEAIVSGMDPERAIDVRDAVTLLVGYDTQRRRSELVAFRWADLSDPFPDGSARLFLARSKTDSTGKGRWLYVSSLTLQWLVLWRAISGQSTGAILRSVRRVKKDVRCDGELAGSEVSRILKKLAKHAGITGSFEFSGHSLRVGKTQDLFENNVSLAEVMRAGGWASPVMPVHYAEALEEGRGAAAKLATKQNRSRLAPKPRGTP